MQQINVKFDDNFELPVYKTGKGLPLIIAHGWTGNAEDWFHIIDRLKDKFTCYLWNCRSYLQAKADLSRLATDINELTDQENINEFVLAGHSMGALVSWEYIKLFGDNKLRMLTIIDQSPKIITDTDWNLGLYGNYTEQDNLAFEDSLQNDFVGTVAELYLNSQEMTKKEREYIRNNELMKERVKRLENFNFPAWIDTWKSLVRSDFRETLKNISVPTYLAYGKKSRFYGVKVAEYVADNIKNADLHLYDKSGHHPHADYAQDFAKKVIKYAKV